MTDSATSTFEAHASGYEALRRQLVPCIDELYGAAVAALELGAGRPGKVLDLGAGTGLLARAVQAAYPDSALTLLDGSPAMLRQARAGLGRQASYVVGDLGEALPAGPWSAVVSALAIHHLDDQAKRDLFGRVHELLAPGAVFVNAEQVSGSTRLIDSSYRRWHRERALELGASAQDWADALERMRFDRLASADAQLGWIADAGFVDVDCLFKDRCFAVLMGRRASA